MRLETGERCDALDNNGRRCRKTAVRADRFHGDGELSYPKVSWVRVAVCAKHAAMTPFSLNGTGAYAAYLAQKAAPAPNDSVEEKP